MNDTKQMYLDFIEDIQLDLKKFEESSLSALSGEKISVNEARILTNIISLQKQSSNTSSEIAIAMKTTRSAISIALRQMEKKRLIFRSTDPNDRRRVFVEPTKTGRDTYSLYKAIHSEALTRIFSVINENDLSELTYLTTRLRNHVKTLMK